MSQASPIVRLLSSIAAGAGGGAVVATLGVMTAWTMTNRGWMPLGDPANLVFVVTGLGLVVALRLGWSLSQGETQSWRRGVAAVLAAFGAVGLGAASMPIEMFYSRTYTVGYLVVLMAVTVVTARLARKHGAAATPSG